MIVLDASAALEVLLRTDAAPVVERRVFTKRESLHAPHLIDIEIAQVIRRFVRGGAMPASRGRQAIADLVDLPVRRYPHDLLLPRVYELRDNLTAYDAVYVALAEVLNAPLVTRDVKLAQVPGHRAAVELL